MAEKDLLNFQEIQLWILRRLGAPLVKVELCQEHLDDIIEDAKRWFAAKKGFQKFATLPITANQVEYLLPEDVDTVLDIALSQNRADISTVYFPFNIFEGQIPYSVFSTPQSMGLYSSYSQTLQYVEQSKRILSAELDWRQDGQKLFIFPGQQKPTGDAIILYKSHCFTVDQLNERDHDLLKRYALALAKKVLGRVRSKYDSYPTAQGSITTDGMNLIDESDADIERLEEEIAQSGYPMGFITG